MMNIDHPEIANYSYFFMSPDFFYFISKLKLKFGHKREFQKEVVPSLQSIPYPVNHLNENDME
jgi:hypothetical protein